jgi:hypothetical protein
MDKDFKKNVSRFAQIFKDSQETGEREANVMMYVVQFLKDVLKYDVFSEISKEYQIKDKYCDIAIKLNGRVAMLIETKQPGIKLAKHHLDQAENYAMKNGTEWAILTNGCEWQLYHFQNTAEGIDRAHVFTTDLLDSLQNNPEEVVGKLSLLHRKHFLRGDLDKYWKKRNLLTPRSLLQAVFTEDVLKKISKELMRGDRVRVGIDEIECELKAMLDKGILADLADVKLKKKKRTRKQMRPELEASPGPSTPPESLGVPPAKKEDPQGDPK